MCRKLIYLMSFVLVSAFFAGQVSAASMGMDGYADRVKICDDGSGNALWYADATGPAGFGDGVAEVSGGAFGSMSGDVLMLGDVSGDGIADRVYARVIGTDTYWTWVADYSTPTGFGDGVADSVTGFGSPTMIPHAVVDLDGDAIADTVVVQDNNPNPWHLYYGDKSPGGAVGFGDGMNEWAQYFGKGEGPTTLIGMSDLNNDGLADSVVNWFPADQMYFVADLATAPAFGDSNPDAGWLSPFGSVTMTPFVGDVSADGYGDRVVANYTATGSYDWIAGLSTSGGFGYDGIAQAGQFGEGGDILLLGDVLVPEPATMMLLGLGGLVLIRRKR